MKIIIVMFFSFCCVSASFAAKDKRVRIDKVKLHKVQEARKIRISAHKTMRATMPRPTITQTPNGPPTPTVTPTGGIN